MQDQRIWGVAERHKSTINRISVGDQMWLYLTSERVSEKKLSSVIAGQAEAASGAFRDTKNVFAVGTTVTERR